MRFLKALPRRAEVRYDCLDRTLETQENVNLNIHVNVKEVATWGVNTCIISLKGLDNADDRFVLPEVNTALALFPLSIAADCLLMLPCISVVMLISSVMKSVTVE